MAFDRKEEKEHCVKLSFETVYDRYYFDIFRYLSKRVQNKQDAEDLTASVFLYCYEHYCDYDPEKSSIITWLYLITNSRLKNHYRDRREYVDLETMEPFLYSEDLALEHAVFLEQLRDELGNALAHLPDKQRQVIVMRYFEEKDYSYIAKRIETTEGNVRVLLSRTLDKIEKQCPSLKNFLE